MDQQTITALCGMDESARKLIALYCGKLLSEQDLADWFAEIKFEALKPEVSGMAAAIAVAQDYNGAPPELVPRLRGIMRYVHTLNSGMAAGLCALSKRYNEAGIPVVLLGGTAVHLGYSEPPRRHIWQMEIGVSESDFSQAVKLASDEGFTVQKTAYNAIARSGNTQCVVIRKGVGLTQEISSLTANGVLFQIPDRSELLVCIAETVFLSLFGAAPGTKLMPQIADLHRVIAEEPDWERTAAIAKGRNTAGHVRLVLDLYYSLAATAPGTNVLDLFSTEDTPERLVQLLPKYRKLKPGSSKLKRLWISTQIKTGAPQSVALKVFLKDLSAAVARKLTPKS